MTHLQRRFANEHTHKYFVDSNTGEAVCLCGKVQGSKQATRGKYNAVSSIYNGFAYDSKFEASVAMDLDWRLRAHEITNWERQYPIINGGAIMDHRTPRERRFVAVPK